MFEVANNLAGSWVAGVGTLASGSFGEVLAFTITLSLIGIAIGAFYLLKK